MIIGGAEICPICAARSWECQHDAVRWSKNAGELEPCRLSASVAAVAEVAVQVLARSRSLRIAPQVSELRKLCESSITEPIDGVLPDCVAWVLDVALSWPGVLGTEDDGRAILWTADGSGTRDRLDDLRTRLEVEMCRQPGELRSVAAAK
jgi:hypothetical protein